MDGWKQAFRLGRKLELRFERPEPPAQPGDEAAKPAPGKKGAAEKKPTLRLLIRLDFSDHEKLSYTRWAERIPAEPPFKDVPHQAVRSRDAAYAETEALFDSLAEAAPGPARR